MIISAVGKIPALTETLKYTHQRVSKVSHRLHTKLYKLYSAELTYCHPMDVCSLYEAVFLITSDIHIDFSEMCFSTILTDSRMTLC